MIKYKIRDSDWLIFPLIIVNFNHFFIQPAPGRNVLEYTAMKVHHRQINPDDDLKRLVLAQSAVEAVGVARVY